MTPIANWRKIARAKEYIQLYYNYVPSVGIILGSGLNGLTEDMAVAQVFTFKEIMGFPKLYNQAAHPGKLFCGELGGHHCIVMDTRFHTYEGYSAEQIAFPIRCMKAMGCHTLIVTNAAGGLNKGYNKGDIMVIGDHINLIESPLRGPNHNEIGPRFPDMSRPYDALLAQRACYAATEAGIKWRLGVYAGVPGPQLETKAEYRALSLLGADAVGMSTTPEVIAAVHCGMSVVGLSVITDLCDPDNLQPANIEDIIEVAQNTDPKLRLIIKQMLEKII